MRWLLGGALHPPAPVSEVEIEVTLVEPAVVDEPVAASIADRPSAPVPQGDPRWKAPGAARGDTDSPSPRGDLSVGPSQGAHQRPAVSLGAPRRSGESSPPAVDTSKPAMDGHLKTGHQSIDLSFEGLAIDAKLRALPFARGDPLLYPSPVRASRRRPMNELMAQSVRQTDAEENVRRGRAHPLLFDYLRAARTRLEPEAIRLAEALPLGPLLSVQGWGRGYLGRLAELGPKASGRESVDSSISGPIGGERRPDLVPAYDEAARQATLGAEQRTAEICLGVAPDRPVVVTLRRSSGHTALDQLAIDSFQRAAVARPVAVDVRPGLACYHVRISAFRAPPLPALSFGIKNGRPDVVYPLKRLTKVTVDLVSVDHGDSNGSGRLLRAR